MPRFVSVLMLCMLSRFCFVHSCNEYFLHENMEKEGRLKAVVVFSWFIPRQYLNTDVKKKKRLEFLFNFKVLIIYWKSELLQMKDYCTLWQPALRQATASHMTVCCHIDKAAVFADSLPFSLKCNYMLHLRNRQTVHTKHHVKVIQMLACKAVSY